MGYIISLTFATAGLAFALGWPLWSIPFICSFNVLVYAWLMSR